MEALANWIWQGSVVTLVATTALRAPRVLGATARYRLWWVAMGIVLVLPVLPALAAWLTPASDVTSVPVSTSLAPSTAASWHFTIPALPRWTTVLIASAWVTWMVVCSAKIAAAIVALRRARGGARAFPADREARLQNWMALRARGRHASLVISDEVGFAAVLGGRAPSIAISPSVAEALDDRDLDRIIVHEWAHVQRHDDAARMLQLVVRAIAGWHPAVWWLDRQIHLDRETACDDWAVNLTGSAKSYAASLTKLAAITPHARSGILMPAIFSSELTRRVVRLLDASRTTSTRRFGPAAAAMLSALLASAFVVTSAPVISIVVRTTAQQVPVASAPSPSPSDSSSPATAPSPDLPSVSTPAQTAPTERAASVPPARASRAVNTRTNTLVSAEPVTASPTSAEVPSPAPASAASAHVVAGPDVHAATELPGTSSPLPAHLSARSGAPSGTPAPESKTPWGAAADAGVNVGRGSQKAAVATAGFFSRLSKSIARSF